MKKTFLCLSILALSTFAFSQETGTASKMSGKDVYVFSEPKCEYDVVDEFTTVSVSVTCPSIDQIVSDAVNKAMKGDKEFDAVIVGAGEKEISIKYKDCDTERKAEASKMSGKLVFIFCEPEMQYDVVGEAKMGLQKMVGCPSISELASSAIKRANKEGWDYDAIVINSGKKAIAVKFK